MLYGLCLIFTYFETHPVGGQNAEFFFYVRAGGKYRYHWD